MLAHPGNEFSHGSRGRVSTSIRWAREINQLTQHSNYVLQLTEGWSLSLWDRVARLIAKGIPPTPYEWPEPRKLRHCSRLKPEQLEEIIAEYRAGATLNELATKWCIHRTTVIHHVHAAGIRKHRSQFDADR